MEVGGAMIPLDDGDGPSRPEDLPQCGQRLDRTREVLQDEADKDMVEGGRVERRREDVRLLEPDVGEARCRRPRPRFGYGLGGDVDGDDSSARAVSGERDGLGADAAPSLEDRAALGV